MDYFPERRQFQRQRVVKGGKVFYQNFALSTDCMIRNQSDHGMRIKVDPYITLPREFSLLNRKEGTLAQVKLVWQTGDEIGVEFTSNMEDVRNFAKSDIRRMSIIATRG
ncbi:MAG: PilZ domain-containing protein [Cohaesibacter sp.]|jgi:hypothetical protein|nr:PilZ domain-containing protein [Cohaesibacter sp.]